MSNELVTLLDAWRRTRHPRLAHLVDVLEERLAERERRPVEKALLGA